MPALEQNYGLIRRGTGRAVLEPIPLPTLPKDYILIQVAAVALNPTDWTSLEATGNDGTLLGCDWAGTVLQIGPEVTKKLQIGDRVAGIGHGANDANPQTGSFARYIMAKGDLVMHIPDSVTWEAASTVGVAIATIGLGMYKLLGLPLPTGDLDKENYAVGTSVLIYGASTATGSVAIQFAKLSGLKVFTTCSPKHFELAKNRGADEIYDYRNEKIGEQIRSDSGSQITKVFDTVSLDSTVAICDDAIAPEGGTYVNLLGAESSRSDVKSIFFLGYSISGEEYIYEGDTYPASPEDFDYGKQFLLLAEKLWAQGKWTPHPERVGPDGLIGVLDGMKQLKEGKVSGEKLVYRVADTKWPTVTA